MHHSAFNIYSYGDTVQGVTLWSRFGIAGGDLTGTQPSGSALWQGVMVGSSVGGDGGGSHLQGDATLTYRLSGSLDAAFTNIKNIDSRRDHSVTTVRFDNVPIASDGTIQAGVTGNRIQGGLYGPDHAETAGTFEQLGIVGAFGAARQ